MKTVQTMSKILLHIIQFLCVLDVTHNCLKNHLVSRDVDCQFDVGPSLF